jgi:hypothetical protein
VPTDLRIPRTALATWGALSAKWGAGPPWLLAPGIQQGLGGAEAWTVPPGIGGKVGSSDPQPEKIRIVSPGSERKSSFFCTQRGGWGLKGTAMHGKR